jgi:hypothetical protein
MSDSSDVREDVIQALVATGKWIEGVARIAERARYKCEYCGLDLLQSVQAYKQFQIDHIVPKKKIADPDNYYNVALACRHCNWDLKGRWDPRNGVDAASLEALEALEPAARRLRLIEVVKARVPEMSSGFARDLEETRRITGYRGPDQPNCKHNDSGDL